MWRPRCQAMRHGRAGGPCHVAGVMCQAETRARFNGVEGAARQGEQVRADSGPGPKPSATRADSCPRQPW